ncbi:MAG: hypothetical protein KAW09_02115, partial [Thermoplasmata archaeon]|nr:hypothetical protein [Thermoplasmata archaeon]
NWPGCKGIYGEGVLLVLVDFQGKELTERPDFYVLDSGEWKNFINTKLRPEIEKGSVRIDPKTNCPTWPSKDGSKPDYKGCDVSPQEVREYEEKWEKLRAALEK